MLIGIAAAVAAPPASAQDAGCLARQHAVWQMQAIRQNLASAYPSGVAPAWYSSLDHTQVQAALRELLRGDYVEAKHNVFDQLHLLPLPQGQYLTLVGGEDQVCGFDEDLIADPVRARASITAADKVRSAQHTAKTARYVDDRKMLLLYYTGLDANVNSGRYPHETCKATAWDSQHSVVPELKELEKTSVWRGQPVTYLSNRDGTAEGFLSHVIGPDKAGGFPWMEGMFLMESGKQTNLILIVRENVCGFDGRVSFATDQVRQWLAAPAPADNQVTMQPGDMIFMTPNEREAFQAMMGGLGGTPMSADEFRRKAFPQR